MKRQKNNYQQRKRLETKFFLWGLKNKQKKSNP